LARRTLRAFENAAGMSSGMRRYQEMGMPVRDLEADQILIFDVLKQTGLKTLKQHFVPMIRLLSLIGFVSRSNQGKFSSNGSSSILNLSRDVSGHEKTS